MASSFKNQGKTITHIDDATSNFYTAGGSVTAVVHALYITNKSSTNTGKANVKVTTDGGTTFYYTAKDIEIGPSNTLTLDKPINLENNDILRVYATPNPDSSTTDMEVFASILEVS